MKIVVAASLAPPATIVPEAKLSGRAGVAVQKVTNPQGASRSRYYRKMIATLTIHLHLPGCASLKEKRGRIKPLIARLHREFNVSVAEMDLQDKWQEAIIVCAMVGNERGHVESALQTVAKWVEGNWTDGDVIEQKVDVYT
jgi:uncharacterized protein